MNLKSASLFALIGTLLLFVMSASDFFSTLFGVLTSVVPALRLLTSLVQCLAVLGLVMFFYAFYKKES